MVLNTDCPCGPKAFKAVMEYFINVKYTPAGVIKWKKLKALKRWQEG
jgi:hypothetical protein